MSYMPTKRGLKKHKDAKDFPAEKEANLEEAEDSISQLREKVLKTLFKILGSNSDKIANFTLS